MPLSKKDEGALTMAAQAISELGYHLIISAEGDADTISACMKIAEKKPRNVEVLEKTLANHERMINECDAIIFFEEPSEEILKEMVPRGIVPITPNGSINFQNYDAQKEVGNAFCYHKRKFWEFMQAIIRAGENFKFTYDWKNLKKNVQALPV